MSDSKESKLEVKSYSKNSPFNKNNNNKNKKKKYRKKFKAKPQPGKYKVLIGGNIIVKKQRAKVHTVDLSGLEGIVQRVVNSVNRKLKNAEQINYIYLYCVALDTIAKKFIRILADKGHNLPNNFLSHAMKIGVSLPNTIQNYIDNLGIIREGEVDSYPDVKVGDINRIYREIVTLMANPGVIATNAQRTLDILNGSSRQGAINRFNAIAANANFQLNDLSTNSLRLNCYSRTLNLAVRLANAAAYVARNGVINNVTTANVLSEYNAVAVAGIADTVFHTQGAFRRHVFNANAFGEFLLLDFEPYLNWVQDAGTYYRFEKVDEKSTLGSTAQVCSVILEDDGDIKIQTSCPLVNLATACESMFLVCGGKYDYKKEFLIQGINLTSLHNKLLNKSSTKTKV